MLDDIVASIYSKLSGSQNPVLSGINVSVSTNSPSEYPAVEIQVGDGEYDGEYGQVSIGVYQRRTSILVQVTDSIKQSPDNNSTVRDISVLIDALIVELREWIIEQVNGTEISGLVNAYVNRISPIGYGGDTGQNTAMRFVYCAVDLHVVHRD